MKKLSPRSPASRPSIRPLDTAAFADVRGGLVSNFNAVRGLDDSPVQPVSDYNPDSSP